MNDQQLAAVFRGQRKSVLRKAFRAQQDELGVGTVVAFADWDDYHPYVEETLQGLYRVGAISLPERDNDGRAIATIEATSYDSSVPVRDRFTDDEVVYVGEPVDLGENAPVGEAINADTGEVTPPGEPLPPVPDADQPENATPLEEPVEPPQEPAPEPDVEPDGRLLDDHKMNELKNIAEREEIELERGMRKDDVVQTIRESREARVAADAEG